jgi:hypothetical protein
VESAVAALRGVPGGGPRRAQLSAPVARRVAAGRLSPHTVTRRSAGEIAALLAEADPAFYDAKRGGRDRRKVFAAAAA